MIYDLDFSTLSNYAPAIFRGACLTLWIGVLSTVVGTVIGAFAGMILRAPLFGPILVFLNDVLRAIPLMVLMFFIYYFPYRETFGVAAPTAFFVAVFAMAVSQAAFTADLVRAAIDGVSKSSIQGGMAIGLRDLEIIRFIVVPDVFRQILPSLSAFFIGNIKLSSIAAVIGCEEIVFTARVAVSQTYRSTEAWLVVGAVYVLLVLPMAWGTRALERSKWMKRR